MPKKTKVNTHTFEFFLNKIERLLAEACKQKDPARWLYKNGLRTPLFMLEALSKLYAHFQHKKKLTNLKERFKELEDILGAIDNYDVFTKEFSKNNKIPKSVIAYLQNKTNDNLTLLNKTLKKERWIVDSVRLNKIKKKLSKVDWLNEKNEAHAVFNFYAKEIKEITNTQNISGGHFKNIESVHELRRNMRWLSIYPHALQGSIQLTTKKTVAKSVEKYLTKEVVNSPFNKLPNAGKHNYFVLLDRYYFFALSWIISELGALKDNGLRVIALQEALQKTEKLSANNSLKKAYQLLGPKQSMLNQIIDDAEKTTNVFFQEDCLKKLLISAVKIQ